VLERARAEPELTAFVQLLERADLEAALAGEEKVTVFAPVDGAFEDLPQDPARWAARVEESELRKFVRAHIVPGRQYGSSNLPETMKTAEGNLSADYEQGRLVIGGRATVLKGDLSAGNGTLHLVDDAVTALPRVTVSEEAPDEELERLVSALKERQEGTRPAGSPGTEAEASADFLTALPARDGSGGGNGEDQEGGGKGGDAPDEAESSGGKPLRADELRGMRITTEEEKRQGRIVAVILSPGDGRIVAVLAEFGGFLGFFGKTVELPWSKMEVARGRPLVIARVSADEISQREAVDPDDY
jgi:hypothetical protein